FFSSRRRHTRWPRDWSSDVCSSDLVLCLVTRHNTRMSLNYPQKRHHLLQQMAQLDTMEYGSLKAEYRPAEPGQSSEPLGPYFKQIGRASCRERVEITVVDVSRKKIN